MLPDVPHGLIEVVDAVSSLPEGALEIRRIHRPPAVLQEVTGPAFGRRFCIQGVRGPDGAWIEVWSVVPA